MDRPSLTRKSSSRRRLIGAIATMVFVGLGIVAWRAWANRDPSPEKIREFVASDRFNQLPPAEKAHWVEAAEKSLEPDAKQEKMFRNLAQARMQTQLDEYFALPEGKSRQEFLDKQIDQQEEIRKMIDSPTTQPGRIVIKRGGATAAAQKELAETVPAEYQAKMAQYVKDIKARRAARGLPTEGVPIGFMIRVNK